MIILGDATEAVKAEFRLIEHESQVYDTNRRRGKNRKILTKIPAINHQIKRKVKKKQSNPSWPSSVIVSSKTV